jgi:dTDP-4-dehydrorhamnose 3,5-epimerase-like enzyme
MKLRVIPHGKFLTKGSDGEPTGFLLPIYNVHEGFIPADRSPQQVYLSVCSPGARKGPHLHLKRWGYLTCVRGNVRVVARIDGQYAVAYSGEDHAFQTVEIPPGVPNCVENLGDGDAFIINTPSPAWRADDEDNHPVSGWDPPPLP